MEERETGDEALRNDVGLCASCLHVRAQETRRGAVFYRCARADEDARFMRYPPIPVTRCVGHERGEPYSE